MTRTRRVRRWALGVAAAAALMAAGGLAYAAIPDERGVIHSCYTTSSGAWRVIDTGLGQTCESNEAALDVYSKDGADARFLRGFDAVLATDLSRLGNGATKNVGFPERGAYPGMSLVLTCDADGGTTLVASSQKPFIWWWDDTFGQTPAGGLPPHRRAFQIGNGAESHRFRSVFPAANYTTTLDLDTQIPLDTPGGGVCTVGSTFLKAANVTPGP